MNMKKARNLLRMTSSMIDETFPELREKREGLTPIYGKIIFANRMEHGYTQQELADLAKVEVGVIYQVEGGYDSLPTETYDKIFKALGLTTSDIAKAMFHFQKNNNEISVTI